MLERVTVVSEYEHEVHSPSVAMKVPSVVCLRRYVRNDYDVPPLTRLNVFIRDRFECQYCGSRYEYRSLTLDHVIPRARGGIKSWENIVAACRDCNARKGSCMPHEGFRPRHIPEPPTRARLQRITRELFPTPYPDDWLDFIE